MANHVLILRRLGTENRPKRAPKTGPNSRRFSRAKKLLFKTLLELSWADLGAFRVPSWGPKKHSGEKSHFPNKVYFEGFSLRFKEGGVHRNTPKA